MTQKQNKIANILLSILSLILLFHMCVHEGARLFVVPAAVIAAGATLAASGGQIYASGKMNKKTRQWNEKMYGIQRADALADWEKQNAYNSPAQQMQRFKEAGLNPNLIYGQQNEGATVRSTDVKSWSPETPDVASTANAATVGIRTHYDTQVKDAQIDNLRLQQELMQQDILLKKAQTLATTANASIGNYNLENILPHKAGIAEQTYEQARNKTDQSFLKTGRDNVLGYYYQDFLKEQLRSMREGTNIALQNNRRQDLLTNSSLKVNVSQILRNASQNATDAKNRQQIDHLIHNIDREGKLKDFEIMLKQFGYDTGIDKAKYASWIAELLLKAATK